MWSTIGNNSVVYEFFRLFIHTCMKGLDLKFMDHHYRPHGNQCCGKFLDEDARNCTHEFGYEKYGENRNAD